MATIQDQNKLLLPEKKKKLEVVKDFIKAITPSKELKDKVKKIAKPFVDESVAIKHLTKKDKD